MLNRTVARAVLGLALTAVPAVAQYAAVDANGTIIAPDRRQHSRYLYCAINTSAL